MIELPEAIVLANQFKQAFIGKTITSVIADAAHHSFAWYTNDDPSTYNDIMKGKTVTGAEAYGGRIYLKLTDDCAFMFCEGTSLRYIEDEKKIPKRHQLLIEFDEGSYLVGTIRMYGGLFAYQGEIDYGFTRNTRSVFSDDFNKEHLMQMSDNLNGKTVSVKSLLTNEQRIPGFGNGVLHDVLFDAKILPKRKITTLADADFGRLVTCIKEKLTVMVDSGGRDVEKDLYGIAGGYKTILSKNTYKNACPRCGNGITKEAFLGGSVYYCAGCQS